MSMCGWLNVAVSGGHQLTNAEEEEEEEGESEDEDHFATLG